MHNAFILSDEEDNSTEKVLDWLYYLKKDFFRLNDTNNLKKPYILLSDEQNILQFEFNDEKLNINDFNFYWYRRGALNFEKKFESFNNKELQKITDFTIRNENNELINFFYLNLEQRNKIGSFYHNHTNKLFNLKTAKKWGLKIPETLVTCDKNDLIQFYKKNLRIITKPLGQAGLVFFGEDFYIDGLTAELNLDDINILPNDFPVSLFQKYIDKKYELRIFYLNGKSYSSAIFSQLDEQTKVDFRNYNREKPNRVCVYNLPNEISEKIKDVMTELNMESGSIDMIVTQRNEFIFLEVNPVGQFAQVSYPCNYYLEKKIAEEMLNSIYEKSKA